VTALSFLSCLQC